MTPQNCRAAAFLLSIALHVGTAVTAVWPGGPLLRVAPAERPPAAVADTGTPPAFPIATPDVVIAGEPTAWRGHAARSALSGLADHLWQSTLFASAIAVAVLGLRKERASVRYVLWFSASLKFFVPFSLLTAAGRWLPWPIPPPVPPSVVHAMSFGPPLHLDVLPAAVNAAAPLGLSPWLAAGAGVWLIGFAGIGLFRLRAWRRVHVLLRVTAPLRGAWPAGVEVRTAPGLLEPGVVGFLKPVILLPAGIQRQLTPSQLSAVVAHEACHVWRRDNLSSSVHMLVEAAYWFHPAVWWIGGRLLHERERACDQEVLRGGSEPRAYAEGLLAVCRRYVDAQVACVSGVTRSSVRTRVEAIMRRDVGRAMSAWKAALLGACGVASVLLPFAAGVMTAPATVSVQSSITQARFETVTIRRHPSADAGQSFNADEPGRLAATNVTVGILIRFAYEVFGFQMAGAPAWIEEDRFDIVATTTPTASLADKRAMLRRLLAERFQLATRVESQQRPIMALSRADSRGGGGRLRPAAADCSQAGPASAGPIGGFPGVAPTCNFLGFGPGTDFPTRSGGLAFRGLTLAGLALKLTEIFGRPVIDRTGLTGRFDADFDVIAEIPLPPPPRGEPRPAGRRAASATTVFPEQLGLKFEAGVGSVDIVLIDRVERPKEN